MDVSDIYAAGTSRTSDGSSMPIKRKHHSDGPSSKKLNILPDEDKIYRKGGVESSLHGVVYQWKLLMLFAVRAQRKGYSFRLATEMEEAEKFDDLVFHYIKNDEQIMASIYLQAKHVEVENELRIKINTNDLLTEKDERFSLQKYFHSFRKISNSGLTNCENSDFIICTNIGFDFDQSYNDPILKRLKVSKSGIPIYFEPVEIEDNFLRGNGEFYRIVSKTKTSSNLRDETVAYLREKFQKTSDMNKLVTNLTECICKDKSIDLNDIIMKTYSEFLISHVIDKESSSISTQFWEKKNDKNISVNIFRNSLLESVIEHLYKLTKLKTSSKIKLTKNENDLFHDLSKSKILHDKKLSPTEYKQLKNNLSKIQLKMSGGFRNVSGKAIKYPEEISDIDKLINSFLDHLLFAVNQPNEQKLTGIISEELGEEFNLIDSSLFTSDFQDQMINWLKEKRGNFLTENKINRNFLQIQQKTIEYIYTGNSTFQQNRSLTVNNKIRFQHLQLGIQEFLQKEALNCSRDDLIFLLKIHPNALEICNLFIYQEIIKIDVFTKNGSFIHLKFDDYRRDIKAFLKMVKYSSWKLLILDCTDENSDILQKNDFNRELDILFDIENKARKKILFVASVFQSGVKCTELYLGFENLVPESQIFVLERRVKFQGQEIKLCDLVCNDQEVEKVIPISEIAITKSVIVIDKEISFTEGYDIDYFIERTLIKKHFVREQISNDLNVIDGKDVIAETENEFIEWIKDNPERNIHLLKLTEEDGSVLLWRKTHGNMSLIQKYLSEDMKTIVVSTQFYSAHDDIEKERKTIIITDTAGMGKTTLLTNICIKFKENYPRLWISRVDLNSFTPELSSLTVDYTLDMHLNFLCDEILKLKTVFEKTLFKSMLQRGEVILFFDGFDEISPRFKEETLALLENIKKTNVRQIWITTRPILKELLEEKFNELSYVFQPFTLEEQTKFIKNFWTKKLSIKSHLHEKLVEKFATGLLKKWKESISEKDIQFAGIPLQTRMLAEAFELEIKTVIDNKEASGSIPEYPETLEILSLYEKFVERKYLIYVSTKSNSLIVNVATRDIIAILKEGVNLRKIHQILSIRTIIRGEKDILSFANKHLEISEEKITRIGIVHINKNNHYFTHQTFAEYFLADFIAFKLFKEMPDSFHVFLIETVLMKVEYQVIRIFFDRLLLRYRNEKKFIPKDIQIGIGNVIAKSWSQNHLETSEHTLLHLNIRENNENILELLHYCCSSTNISENEELRNIYKKMLNCSCGKDSNVWKMSVYKGNLNFLRTLWTWSSEILTRHELINYMKTDRNTIVWDSVRFQHPAVIREMCAWVGEIDFDADELLNLILIENDEEEFYENNTPWHYAVKNCSLETVEALWNLCPKVKQKQLLLSRLKQKQRNLLHYYEINAFQLACQKGKIIVLMKLWEWISQLFHEQKDREKILCDPVQFRMDFSTDWEIFVTDTIPSSKEQKMRYLTEKNSRESDFGNCAIHLAVKGEWFEAFKFVFECHERQGKDSKFILSMQNKQGTTVLNFIKRLKKSNSFQQFNEFLVQKSGQNLLCE